MQKLLARRGLGSRRDMEQWIAAGRVTVNGVRARLGQRVTPQDRIKVDDRLVSARAEHALPRVLLYHKPAGEIVSAADPEGRPTAFDRLPRLKGGRWVAVGRLDFNTSGLLVFTNSGDLAARLMHPRHGIEREYAARIDGMFGVDDLQRLTTGVLLEDGPARCEAIADGGGTGRNHWYRIVLKEGRNREVRRMVGALGRNVSRLIRIRYGPIVLPPWLRRGRVRELPATEVTALLNAVSATPAPRAPSARSMLGRSA